MLSSLACKNGGGVVCMDEARVNLWLTVLTIVLWGRWGMRCLMSKACRCETEVAINVSLHGAEHPEVLPCPAAGAVCHLRSSPWLSSAESILLNAFGWIEATGGHSRKMMRRSLATPEGCVSATDCRQPAEYTPCVINGRMRQLCASP